jgi:hypothetical protein
MERYEAMKTLKASDKSIIATAGKPSKIVWFMLTREEAFNVGLMTDDSLEAEIESMRRTLNTMSV